MVTMRSQATSSCSDQNTDNCSCSKQIDRHVMQDSLTSLERCRWPVLAAVQGEACMYNMCFWCLLSCWITCELPRDSLQ